MPSRKQSFSPLKRKRALPILEGVNRNLSLNWDHSHLPEIRKKTDIYRRPREGKWTFWMLRQLESFCGVIDLHLAASTPRPLETIPDLPKKRSSTSTQTLEGVPAVLFGSLFDTTIKRQDKTPQPEVSL